MLGMHLQILLKHQTSAHPVATSELIGVMQMWAEGRYKEVIFISDTCQAASLYGKVRSPNLIAMASSRIGMACLEDLLLYTATCAYGEQMRLASVVHQA